MSANKQKRRAAILRDPTSGRLIPRTPDEFVAIGLPRPAAIWSVWGTPDQDDK